MWIRKELKTKAKHTVKTHYFRLVIICLTLAYFFGSFSENGSMQLLQAYNEEHSADAIQDNTKTNIQGKTSNAVVVEDTLKNFAGMDSQTLHTKYSKGVLSQVVNNATDSGSLLFGMLNLMNQAFFGGNVGRTLVLALGLLLTLLSYILISGPIKVSANRYFLEASHYENVSMQRVLFVYKMRKMLNVSYTMFIRSVYLLFWAFTIVGVLIKSYSYMMIPYILAENPNTTKKQAFALSRAMMNGQKWNAFKLDLSFLLWRILGFLTGGIFSILYLNPYITSTKAELYYVLREKAIADKLQYFECFTDEILATNAEVLDTYPLEKILPAEALLKHENKHPYIRNYSITSIILLFFTFSFIGWCWEVSLHLSRDGFVNRGVQHGPWLPIYGAGGVLVLILLKKLRQHQVLTFLGVIIICGTLEYFTSWYLQMTHGGTKWWDYSGYFLNLNGRICAEGLLVFGLGGYAFIYFAAPFFDDLYLKIPNKIKLPLCIALLSIFTVDVMYSHKHPNMGKGITDYKDSHIEELYVPQRQAEVMYRIQCKM